MAVTPLINDVINDVTETIGTETIGRFVARDLRP